MGFFGVGFGFLNAFDHHIGFRNASQNVLVVHAEALVGSESIDANFDVIDGEEEAYSTTSLMNPEPILPSSVQALVTRLAGRM